MAAIITTTDAAAEPVRVSRRSKVGLFFGLNFGLLLVMATGLAFGSGGDPGLVPYISTLFALCTAPLLFIKTMRGRAALMVAFLGFYFATFALQDVASLMSDLPTTPRPAGAI